MNVCVIGDSETVTGFALAGVKNIYEVDSAEAALSAYNSDSSPIVIVGNSFADLIEKNRSDDRVLVRVGLSIDHSILSKLIKETLGFEARL